MPETSNHEENKWAALQIKDQSNEEVAGPGVTYRQDVWRRLKQNKLAISSIFIIAVILLLSVFGPMLTGKTYNTQELNLRNMPLKINIITATDGTNFYVHEELRLFITNEKGKIIEYIEPVKKELAKKRYVYEVKGSKYTLDFSKDGLRLLGEDGIQINITKKVWNKNYILGTDSLGRDMLTRLLYGGRISLLVAFITSFITLIVGVLYGGISGYYGSNIDVVMMRMVEIIEAIPNTIYVILLMVYMGQGVRNILIAMAITSWLSMSRLVRGQVLALKEQEFILSAKSIGVSSMKIIVRHLLPNCIGPIIVSATLSIPSAIATEAFMSFIGLGVAPPMPSWGILCNEGIGAIRSYPYQILLPSAAISITMFAFNFLGDGLRDALDPRLRK